MSFIAYDLFDWAAKRPPEKVVDFIAVRKTLPRYERLHPLRHFDRAMARRAGTMALAPIIAFPDRHPASPGSYSPSPAARAQR